MNTPVNSEYDPQHTIRSDLWSTMDISQLTQQQDLVITKISTMHRMLGPSASPTMYNLYAALQVALQDLNQLIDNRSKTNKQR